VRDGGEVIDDADIVEVFGPGGYGAFRIGAASDATTTELAFSSPTPKSLCAPFRRRRARLLAQLRAASSRHAARRGRAPEVTSRERSSPNVGLIRNARSWF
jgi:hypothetical protein